MTLVVDRVAAFPDAVSERGTKHLKELIRLRRRGNRAVLLFVIQRAGCPSFRPADEIDPEYGRWLRRAVKAGVEVYPTAPGFTTRAISLKDAVRCTLEKTPGALPHSHRRSGTRLGRPVSRGP